MESTDLAAAEGTFETSKPSAWRSFGVAVAVGAGGLVFLTWMAGEPLPAGAYVAAFVAALGYALWNETQAASAARRVEVHPDRVRVAFWNGEQDDVSRTDLVDHFVDSGPYKRRAWVLETRHDVVRIPDLGFSGDDSAHLTIALQEWKLQTDAGPMPGVSVVEPQGGARQYAAASGPSPGPSGDLVWEAKNVSAQAQWVAGVLFGVFGCGAAWAMRYTAMGAEMQAELPVVSLLLPVSLFLTAGLIASAARGSAFVGVARFERDGLRLGLTSGQEVRVPYASVRDLYRSWLDTDRQTFFLGRKNADVFQTLLLERVPSAQLSGRRWLTVAIGLSAEGLVAAAAAVVLVGWAAWATLRADGYLTSVVATTAASVVAYSAHTRWTRARADAALRDHAD